MQREFKPFWPVTSTEPSFNSSAATVALQSTATNRMWTHQVANRSVRLASQAATDFYVTFGSSTIAATTSGAELILGGTAEVHHVMNTWTYISIASSTDVTVNVTLGTGS